MEQNLAGLGKRIKTIRVSLGYTQADVAGAIGHGVKYYQSLENGRRNFNLEILVKICRMFSITLNDLVDIQISETDNVLADKCKENIIELLDKMNTDDLVKLSTILTSLYS